MTDTALIVPMHLASNSGVYVVRHALAQGMGVTSLALAILALLGTLYAVGFALIGIFVGFKNDDEDKNCFPTDGIRCATKFLVVVPAHNESSGLTATIASVLAQEYPKHHVRCVVVADNCTDDTAEIAAAAGAQVVIRTDTARQGKGHALGWTFALLQELAWDAVCIIDADSVVEPGFLQALDASLKQGNHVVQARYDFLPARDHGNWLQQFTSVSKAGENSFVYRSRERLGLSQLLVGNGFCVSRYALERVPWLAHSIVEDAEYALSLGQKGIAVHYQERARLWSRQASTVRDAQPQRVRWASGTWQLLRQAIPVLLTTAWRDRNWHALEEIVMLLMTSRIVLIYLLIMSFALSLAGAPTFFFLTWSLLAGVALLQLVYLVLMFRFACDRPVPIVGLLRLPYYVSVIVSAQVLALLGFNRRVWWRTAR